MSAPYREAPERAAGLAPARPRRQPVSREIADGVWGAARWALCPRCGGTAGKVYLAQQGACWWCAEQERSEHR